MAVLDVIVGYVRGLKGDTGETGATGATGEAATISVGTVSTAAYGQQAQVTNVGTSGAAVFDFVIPEGRPGEVLADMSNLTNNTITTSTSEFPVPAVGDTGATLWGKVVKFFSDIRTAVNAKIDTSKISTSLAVTATGSVADATVSKVLNDKITTLNDNINTLCIYKGYSYQYTINANASLQITASNFNISVPSGYTAVAIRAYTSGNPNVMIRAVDASGGIVMRNLASTEQTASASMTVLYMRSASVSQG